MTLRWWRALTMGLALALIAPVVHAADAPFDAGTSLSQEERAKLQAEYDRLFAQMLGRPTDLDLMFSFAAVAARLGNYEAAISTLERMLLLNSPVTKSLSDHPISGAITTTSMAIWPSTVAINTSASVSSV